MNSWHRGTQWTLASLIFAAGLWAAVFSLGMTVGGFTSVPYNDEWWVLRHLSEHQGGFPLHLLFSAQNEHRVVISRLVAWVDGACCQQTGALAVALIYLVQLSQALLFIWTARRHAGLRGPAMLTASGIALFCAMSPSQVANFVWSFQIAFVATFLFAHAAAYLWATPRPRPWLLVGLGSALMIAASFGIASGVAVGFMATLLLWRFGAGRRPTFTMLGIFIVYGALYAWGLQPLSGVSPWSQLQHPVQIAQYVVMVLREALPHWFASRPGLILLPLFVLAAASARATWKARQADARVVWSGLAVFLLVNLVLTAMGRLYLGLDQAREGRYQTPALLLCCCCALLILLAVSQRTWLLIATQIAVFACMSERMQLFEQRNDDARSRQRVLDTAGAALFAGAATDAELAPLIMGADVMRVTAPFMRAHDWAPYSWHRQFPLGQTITNRYPISQRAAMCQGNIEAVRPLPQAPGTFRVEGWALQSRFGHEPRWVILTDRQMRVLGVARAGWYRPEVKLSEPNILTDSTGFIGYLATGVDDGRLRAFVLLDRWISDPGPQLCEIENRQALSATHAPGS